MAAAACKPQITGPQQPTWTYKKSVSSQVTNSHLTNSHLINIDQISTVVASDQIKTEDKPKMTTHIAKNKSLAIASKTVRCHN